MPSNHTTNYQLSQWSKTDRVLMSEFNADNAKIDAALASKASAAALSALQSTVSGHTTGLGLRNCRLYTGSYQGTAQGATCGPVTLTFPYRPVFFFICATGYTNFFTAVRGQTVTYRTEGRDHLPTYLDWGDKSLRWSPSASFGFANSDSQMNEDTDTYHYFAILEVE